MLNNKRTDIVTNQKYERDELIRIAIKKNGETTIDYEFNQGGRGIYIKYESIKMGLNKNIIKNKLKRFNGNMVSIKQELERILENG